MIHASNPRWLTADMSLLQTDTQQLRLHLNWLLADLQTQHDQLDDQAATLIGLATEVARCLPQLDQLDALLIRVGQVTL